MEFTTVMRNWKRMCSSYGSCSECRIADQGLPLSLCSDGMIENVHSFEFERVEEVIKEWLEDHPEPKYPSWFEWLQSVGVIPKEGIIQTSPDVKIFCEMSEDITRKLGIKPREVQNEPAAIEDMELGNLMFGNSRGLYAVEPREDYREIFCDFLKRNGFDMRGYKEGHEESCVETDKYILRPYYWGEDEDIAELPNFVYKPTGLEISWYKYPMRDAYSNQDVSVEEFRRILRECDWWRKDNG